MRLWTWVRACLALNERGVTLNLATKSSWDASIPE